MHCFYLQLLALLCRQHNFILQRKQSGVCAYHVVCIHSCCWTPRLFCSCCGWALMTYCVILELSLWNTCVPHCRSSCGSLRNLQPDFHGARTSVHTHRLCVGVPFCPYSQEHLIVFLTSTILTGEMSSPFSFWVLYIVHIWILRD